MSLNGWNTERDGRYPGALPVGPEAAAIAREAERARANAPTRNVYEPELAKMLGIPARDVVGLYVSALAGCGFPKPMTKYELQKFPKVAKEIHYWQRYEVEQWIGRYREVTAAVRLEK